MKIYVPSPLTQHLALSPANKNYTAWNVTQIIAQLNLWCHNCYNRNRCHRLWDLVMKFFRQQSLCSIIIILKCDEGSGIVIQLKEWDRSRAHSICATIHNSCVEGSSPLLFTLLTGLPLGTRPDFQMPHNYLIRLLIRMLTEGYTVVAVGHDWTHDAVVDLIEDYRPERRGST